MRIDELQHGQGENVLEARRAELEVVTRIGKNGNHHFPRQAATQDVPSRDPRRAKPRQAAPSRDPSRDSCRFARLGGSLPSWPALSAERLGEVNERVD